MEATWVHETQRPRHGQRFQPTRELELLPTAIAAARSLPGSHRGLRLVQELAGPYGIPDIAAVVGPTTRLTDRLALPIPPLLNEIDAGIVAACSPLRGRSVEAIAGTLAWAPASIRRRIPALLKTHALVRTDRGTFIRPEGLAPLGTLYAIEAKVEDWRRAVAQARRYRTWADGYVIVMGAVSSRGLEWLTTEVSRDGGGLLVSEGWICRPRKQTLPPARRLWAAEHVVAASLTATSSLNDRTPAALPEGPPPSPPG